MNTDRHPICIEDEEGGSDPSIISGVKALAETLQSCGKGLQYIHPSKEVADRFGERDRRSFLRTALSTLLKQQDVESRRVRFCGWPELVEDFLVFPILELNRAAYESLPALALGHQVGESGTFPRSLVDAIVQFFQAACSKSLRQPQPGSNFETICPNEMEAFRHAAESFMYAASSAGGNIYGLHGLYSACNGVSSLHYEGIEGAGKLVISKRRHPEIDMVVELKMPVKLHDYRAIRKLLEISGAGQSLLSDSAVVYGLGRVLPSYNPARQDIFVIEFVGHYQWRVLHSGLSLMEVAYDQPQLPKLRLARDRFELTMRRIFTSVPAIDLDNIWKLVCAAMDQRHGTMLVISDAARLEADRLASQSTVVAPLKLTPEILRLVSKIDGAVLIDPGGMCFSIGVILDGMASTKGTPSRGARYNSAIRYTESGGHKTLAVVVSEDGSVDLIPELRPRIGRAEITNRITELSALHDSKQPDMRRFYALMDWFSSHRFYLVSDVCQQLNRMKAEICDRHLKVSTDMVVITPDFEPDPDMTPEYLLPE